MYEGVGTLTMGEAMIWYIVLWSEGCEGSWRRPAPQQETSVFVGGGVSWRWWDGG